MMDFLIKPQNLIAVATTIAVFATIITLVMPLLARDTLGDRMKSVALERDKLRAQERARMVNESKEKRGGAKRREPGTVLKTIVNKLNLKSALADEKTGEMLMQAGYRGQNPLFVFLALRFGLPFVFGALAAFYFFVVAPPKTPNGLMTLLKCVGAAGVGFYLPNVIVKNQLKKRQLSITMAWPDALDLCLICVESGMSIEASFRKVAAEIGSQSVELAEELMVTTAELAYLQERKHAYENLVMRTGLDTVKNVVLSLMQAERYGTPLASALRVLSQENRDERMNKAEKKAAALPPKLTVPMMICFLPVLFCVILSPAIIRSIGILSKSGPT